MQRALIVLMSCLLMVSVTFAEGKVNIAVEGMKCKNCVDKVEKALKGVEGVKEVKVSLKNKSAEVMFASDAKVENSKLVNAIADAGFKATAGEVSAEPKQTEKDECEGMSGCSQEGKEKKNQDCMKQHQEKKTEKVEKKKS
jgi:copper ion binding protein